MTTTLGIYTVELQMHYSFLCSDTYKQLLARIHPTYILHLIWGAIKLVRAKLPLSFTIFMYSHWYMPVSKRLFPIISLI